MKNSNFKEKAFRLLQQSVYRTQRFMQGRNGTDFLSKDLYRLALFLFVISLFIRNAVLSGIVTVLMAYVLFRTLSKNLGARQRENALYCEKRRIFLSKAAFEKRKWDDRKTYRYYVCPSCGRKLRVPKGRGKIEVHCPCGNSFDRKS